MYRRRKGGEGDGDGEASQEGREIRIAVVMGGYVE